jgi:CheY-like chemotaxis protein
VGAARFLSKPVLPSALYNTLVEVTGNKALMPKMPQSAQNKRHDWSQKHLLLVEDIEINREILINILEETGVQIDSAETGVQAVDMFCSASEKYDVVLMDVQMPELDGLGATEQIRACGLPRAAETPILAMTANAFMEDVENCLAAGMNGHVAKPIDVDELMTKLGLYLD